jgi:hypothetical protein
MRTACVRARRLAGTTVLALIVAGVFGVGSIPHMRPSAGRSTWWPRSHRSARR